MTHNQNDCPLHTMETPAHVVRDMILLALDATEVPNLPEQNRIEARAALVEALDAIKGVVQ